MQNFSTPMKVRCSAGRGFEVSGDGPDNLVERAAGVGHFNSGSPVLTDRGALWARDSQIGSSRDIPGLFWFKLGPAGNRFSRGKAA
jgi:hypothetical protein